MRFGVVVFPGSNCDADCLYVLEHILKVPAEPIWHQARDLHVDCVILPGGFAYGDYLRAGAIARFSPIMAAVERFAREGGLVLGICNGFQILCEAGLLPGALLRNAGLTFRCEWVHVRVENVHTPFTHRCQPGQVLRLPIAHGEGRYYLDPAGLQALEARGGVVLRYATPTGEVHPSANPNGSLHNIAGIVNETGNVFGLMPHPERAAEPDLGSTDGWLIFAAVRDWLAARQSPDRPATLATRR